MQVAYALDELQLFWWWEKPKDTQFEPHAKIKIAQVLWSPVYIYGNLTAMCQSVRFQVGSDVCLHFTEYSIILYLDNNNCTPSFLMSLCEIGGDCLGPRYFSEGAAKVAQLPKKNIEVQTITDEFTRWPKQRWCKDIIVINNRYLYILNAF